MFRSFLQDLRVGFRVLIKDKSFCFLAVRARDERDLARTELIGRAEFKDRSLFAAFGDSQCLGRTADDRQLVVRLRAQFDFSVLA